MDLEFQSESLNVLQKIFKNKSDVKKIKYITTFNFTKTVNVFQAFSWDTHYNFSSLALLQKSFASLESN